MDASNSSATPINGKTATGSITPEQSGKVYVGSGGKKEAELVGLGLSKLIKSQVEELDKAKKYAMDQSIRYVMEKQRQKHQQQQQKVALYSQALALMGRIYVGSINFDVYEEQIRSVFGIYGPIKHVNMSIDPSTGNHKGFCFIEYEVPEAAHLARDSMNGKLLSGRSIKVMPVGRQDSTPQAQPIIDMVMNEARQYSRVYVACVHPDITENDLRSVFMAFGEMTKCQLARHPSGKKHRGFGYIEFKDADSVKDAIEGMNGFDLGGQCLQVGRAVTPPDAVNYMCAGTASSALPAAAAIAAAELTAKIHAQEILGTSKTSPDASPNQNGASPSRERGSSSPTLQQSSTQTNAIGRRRGGFGGFASVPPPAIIQSANQLLALPASQQGSGGQSISAASSPSNEATAISAPQLVIPQLGGGLATAAVPAKQTLAEAQTQQEDSPINDFYTTLKDEKFEPPKLVIPTLSTTFPKQQAKAACPQKPKVAAPIALPSTIPAEHKPKKAKKEKVVGLDLLDRIGEKAKAKSDGFDATKKATFAPLARHLAPKDPNAGDDDEEESGSQLAIGGPESWTALAIREEGGVVAKKSTNSIDKKGKKKGDKKNERGKRKGKGRKKPRYSSGPKLNTATKLAAANLAGALSDNLQTQKDEKGEEASLASQEHVQIRGNDARHLLIQKLMRTNRSSVVVLRNLVTPEGVDEHLEEEIREECQRYGRVIDVVIVQEEDIASVKIFVRFAEPTQAETARKAIDGRFFDGRTVSAQAYDQVLFDHDDFTG